MTCFGCCYGRRVGILHPAVDDDQIEPPRLVNRLSKGPENDASVHHIDATERHHPRVSPAQAHEDLTSHLQQPLTAAQSSAMSRLQSAFTPPLDQLTPSLLTQAIPDLDTVLFNSTLTPHIKIEWANLTVKPTRILRGITLIHDIDWRGITKVRIRLNKAMLRVDSKEEIWGTIVHEMLHAWLDTRCGWGGLAKPQHGSAFERSCAALVERLGLQGVRAEHVI